MEGNRRHLGLVLLILLYSGHAHSQSMSCQEASSCCACVATPGCSWYYNSTLPEPFCDYTPHGYSSLTNVDETLETRTPYALVKRVIQPRGKCKPINRSRGRMITPQAVQVKQNVGLRQEIQFEVMAMSRSLRMRVVDGTGGAVGFSVKPSFSNTCPGRFTAVGRNHRRGRRLVVTCSRASPGEVSKFKLVLDQLACYSDPRELRVILLEPNSRKRLRVFVEPNCACPCSSSSSSTTSSSPSSSSSSSSSSPSSSSPSSSPSSSSTPQNADVIRNGGGRGGRRRGGGRSESEPSARGRRSESERSAVAAPACVADCGAAWTTPLSDGTCNNDMCHATASESPCSDNGVCVCGQCACGRPASAEDRRIASIFTNMPVPRPYGHYCECSDSGCQYYESQLCGGPTRGRCSCNRCVCMANYTGEACDISLEDTNCRPPGDYSSSPCSGRGRCMYNLCICRAPYQGTYCQDCPTCTTSCRLHRRCAQCLRLPRDAIQGRPDHCESCENDSQVQYLLVSSDEDREGETRCTFRGPDSCIYRYSYQNGADGSVTVYVQTQAICPQP